MKPNTKGSKFNAKLEIDVADKASYGTYEIKFLIYMFCEINCIENNDFISIIIQNVNEENLATELIQYKTYEFKEIKWIQKSIIFTNNLKDIKVKNYIY